MSIPNQAVQAQAAQCFLVFLIELPAEEVFV
jgi:hypothetical protein